MSNKTNHLSTAKSKHANRYTPQQKLEHVLMILSGAKTITDISKETKISPDTLIDWKKYFLKTGHKIFDKSFTIEKSDNSRS